MDLWDGFEDRVVDLVDASGATSVGELGGGANPTVAVIDRVSRPVELTVLDISEEELARLLPACRRSTPTSVPGIP